MKKFIVKYCETVLYHLINVEQTVNIYCKNLTAKQAPLAHTYVNTGWKVGTLDSSYPTGKIQMSHDHFSYIFFSPSSPSSCFFSSSNTITIIAVFILNIFSSQ